MANYAIATPFGNCFCWIAAPVFFWVCHHDTPPTALNPAMVQRTTLYNLCTQSIRNQFRSQVRALQLIQVVSFSAENGSGQRPDKFSLLVSILCVFNWLNLLLQHFSITPMPVRCGWEFVAQHVMQWPRSVMPIIIQTAAQLWKLCFRPVYSFCLFPTPILIVT